MRQFKINQSITKRSGESLDKYLVDISRIPMITPDQEVELAQSIRKGGKKGQQAKDKLITANLRFVVSVAKQYQNQGISLSDLIDEGNIGLITAADKFDETRIRLPSATRSRTPQTNSSRKTSVIRQPKS